jgi:hypothetical protein
LDRVARDQALLVRRIAAGALGALSGPRGRAVAYDFFSGEYLFGAIGSADGCKPAVISRTKVDSHPIC